MRAFLAIAAVAAFTMPSFAAEVDYGNAVDLERREEFATRDADWRNGALVYQVIVDRFAPSANLDAKRDLYPAPKTLRKWEEVPKRGTYVESANVWSHEIDFWGGDLQSLRTRIDYVQELGISVLYLNPIHEAYTNHKYDAQNYFGVSKEYGTREDVTALAKDLEGRGMRLVLDGVVNHMGRTSPDFKDAAADPNSKWRDWFYIGDQYKKGYRAWVDVDNLPELNLENKAVRDRLWNDKDSVIQGYLREGVSGWRLDVAYDIGFTYLDELTRAAHSARADSLVIGEIWNYPEEWSPALDGVMNMTGREIILQMVRGNIPAARASRTIETLVDDYGIGPTLKSWIILDNHDTPRLRTVLPEPWQQRMAQVLQFTIPGSPCIYYGVELGMEGGDDPEQRGPMRWDLVNDSNEQLKWMRSLIKLHRDSRGLRIGDFRRLDTDQMMAFLRRTDRIADTVLVAVNPSPTEVKELLVLRDSKIMSYSKLRDAFTGEEYLTMAGTLTLTLPARGYVVLQPMIPDTVDYSSFKRVQ